MEIWGGGGGLGIKNIMFCLFFICLFYNVIFRIVYPFKFLSEKSAGGNSDALVLKDKTIVMFSTLF